jgi:hypothetical protein
MLVNGELTMGFGFCYCGHITMKSIAGVEIVEEAAGSESALDSDK